MSDDLISRKDFITEMEINIGNIYNPDIIKGMKFAIELANSMIVAFDKEKVIGELRKREENSIDNQEWNLGGELLDLCIIHEHHGENRAYRHAIEIVEKGGIK